MNTFRPRQQGRGGGGGGGGAGGARGGGPGKQGGGWKQQQQQSGLDGGLLKLGPQYDGDLELCKKFLSGYRYGAPDELTPGKYMKMMDEICLRTRRQYEIELDDVARSTDIENVLDFIMRIESNTLSYIRLFTAALESLMPERNVDFDSIQSDVGNSSDAVIDLLMAERNQRQQQQQQQQQDQHRQLNQQSQQQQQQGGGAKKNDNSALPAELLRRFELLIIPRRLTRNAPIKIREIRSEHIGRLVSLEGIVTRVTDVKPMVTVAAYTCDNCGAEMFQEVLAREFMPMISCRSQQCAESGQVGSLTLQSRGSKFIKFQELKIQEKSDNVPIGHTPRTIKVFARGELTRQVSPGDMITLHGIFLPTPYSGHKAIRAGLLADTYVEAMRIVQHKKTYEQYVMTETMEEQLNAATADGTINIYEQVAKSIAPEIYGHLDVKKSLLLQMIGAPAKRMADGMNIRGDINICLMGDPGVAKSQLLKHISKIAPRGIYTSGKGSSGVGLTAAVIKDSVTGDYVLEGGSLVLADMGICCIDEFDKMEDADRTAIHEVMEQQTISIAKAGITTTLNARTSVLAAANPAFGRYNFKKKPDENFNLPPSLLSRFDILYLIVDRPDLEKDRLLSEHVTYVHQNSKPPELSFQPYDAEFIRCFVSRARRHQPFVPKALTEFIVNHYVTMRKQEGETKDPFTYTTARTLLGILRLAQAHARCQLRDQVEGADVDEAMRLMYESKASIRIDREKRKQVDPITAIYALIRDHCSRNSTNMVKYADILPRVLTAGFNQLQLNDCLDEYKDMSILMVDDPRTVIRIVGGHTGARS
ncbi:hypothetical protein SAMD00019534_099500 [Acytostelium subglobosum LB1]|uniref:hypothetical protein n=1 Tax=Acytostelium subglobosum LB1 TaxID=1410327 RepID=UPI0006449A20|nr:hypothetical protein SAMD00019534_099500 [Acytostelium subglobosum LB1]GAM26775.1 hypothetical protein SAMD00019534_099500 [Acytostelium subglobosum LB1]|eukprot:XP_012750436.1 hypothetical protein SAMD00019534_099500 [Acytostelium subglobosum LB1]